MRYTYVGIDARQFTYQFLGEIFRLCHTWRVTWRAAKDILVYLWGVNPLVGYDTPATVSAPWPAVLWPL